MSGPLPLSAENPRPYGEETDIQKNIQSASQYNPATKLGITNEDHAKTVPKTMPTTQEILSEKTGLGPESGLEELPKDFQMPVPKPYDGPHSFTSLDIAEHKSHLGRLTNLSPALQEYLSGA